MSYGPASVIDPDGSVVDQVSAMAGGDVRGLVCLDSLHTPIHKGGGLWPPPQIGRAAFRRPPPFVETLMGAGEAASTAKY